MLIGVLLLQHSPPFEVPPNATSILGILRAKEPQNKIAVYQIARRDVRASIQLVKDQ